MKTHLTSLALCVGLLFNSVAGSAAECETDTIKSVRNSPQPGGSSGIYIATSAGRMFEVLGQDFIDPTRWQPQEQITICVDEPESSNPNLAYYKITNLKRSEVLVVLSISEIPPRSN